ncbi:hypothetical protein GCM10025762_61250 [Haloechinothrix salitolerans]
MTGSTRTDRTAVHNVLSVGHNVGSVGHSVGSVGHSVGSGDTVRQIAAGRELGRAAAGADRLRHARRLLNLGSDLFRRQSEAGVRVLH